MFPTNNHTIEDIMRDDTLPLDLRVKAMLEAAEEDQRNSRAWNVAGYLQMLEPLAIEGEFPIPDFDLKTYQQVMSLYAFLKECQKYAGEERGQPNIVAVRRVWNENA